MGDDPRGRGDGGGAAGSAAPPLREPGEQLPDAAARRPGQALRQVPAGRTPNKGQLPQRRCPGRHARARISGRSAPSVRARRAHPGTHPPPPIRPQPLQIPSTHPSAGTQSPRKSGTFSKPRSGTFSKPILNPLGPIRERLGGSNRREAPGGPRTGPQLQAELRPKAIPDHGPVRGPLDPDRRSETGAPAVRAAWRSVVGAGFALTRDAGRRPALQAVPALHAWWRTAERAKNTMAANSVRCRRVRGKV